MESNIFAFYTSALILLGSAIGVIFLPKMYLSLFSFFCLILSSCFLYWGLGAKYLSVFQFILCGFILCGYLFLLLKKIDRINAKLYLKKTLSIIFGFVVVILFGASFLILFFDEYNNSLYSIFNFVQEKAFDSISYVDNMFPISLVILLVVLVAIVIRVILLSTVEQTRSSEEDE